MIGFLLYETAKKEQLSMQGDKESAADFTSITLILNFLNLNSTI